MTFFALLRKRPMVLICSIRASSPRASIFSGVSAIWNSLAGGLVHPGIRGLRRQRDGHQKGEGVGVVKLAPGMGFRLRKAGEDLIQGGIGKLRGHGPYPARNSVCDKRRKRVAVAIRSR
jgi:hypothetical protein